MILCLNAGRGNCWQADLIYKVHASCLLMWEYNSLESMVRELVRISLFLIIKDKVFFNHVVVPLLNICIIFPCLIICIANGFLVYLLNTCNDDKGAECTPL